MGAKAAVKGASTVSPKLDFPVLMVSGQGSVVLFDSPTSGTCVFEGAGSLMTFGQYAANRIIASFKPFYGEVVLENE